MGSVLKLCPVSGTEHVDQPQTKAVPPRFGTIANWTSRVAQPMFSPWHFQTLGKAYNLTGFKGIIDDPRLHEITFGASEYPLFRMAFVRRCPD